MSEFLTNLIVALVVAAVSAVTYVAYRHPDGYKRIHKSTVWGLWTLILSFCIIWITNWMDFVVGVDNGIKHKSLTDEKLLEAAKEGIPIFRKQMA